MAALGYRGRLEDGLGPMIDLLLDAGTSPNSPPSEEYTSLLHAAIRKGKLDLARKLLDKGADANAHDARFGTPLTAASSVGDVTLMKRLIGMGADPSLAGNEHGSVARNLQAKYLVRLTS
jgi:ankyrin repeat protein